MNNMALSNVTSNTTRFAETDLEEGYISDYETSSPRNNITFLDPERMKDVLDDDSNTSILIVEDEAGVRDLLEQLLDLEGYKTTAVDNGSEAVVKFREQHHDLVFTDFRMPGMSGAEVARAIKAFSERTPVVVVTGWDPETFQEELRAAGVDHVLKKPFNMDEILDLVSNLTHS